MSGVCGTFPETLFRSFSRKEHADAFLSGEILVRRNSYYRTVECKSRQDGDEGEGYYLKRGLAMTALVSPQAEVETEWRREHRLIKRHVSFGNAVFLLCCSNADVSLDFLRKKFGAYLVRLDDPRALACEIDTALKKRGLSFSVNGQNVSYSRGDEFPESRDDKTLVDLAFTQKSAAFAEEREFRFCLIGMSTEYVGHRCDVDEMRVSLGVPVPNAALLR